MDDRHKVIAFLGTDIYSPEIISFILGIKPVIYAAYRQADIKNFRSAFPKASITTVSKNICGQKDEVALISEDKRLAEEAAKNISDNSRIGKLLGYPECCIKTHTQRTEEGPSMSVSESIFEAFSGISSAPFVINNLLNFVTRIKTTEELKDADEYWKKNSQSGHLKCRIVIDEKQTEADLLNISFISHLPCRYDCKESIAIGRQVAKWMKDNIPELFAFFKATLQRPFLIFDTFNWIAFDGKIENGVLKYSGIVPPFTFIKNPVKDHLDSGDSLKTEKNKITILKNGQPVFEYTKKDEKDGYLINFTDCEI